MNEEIKKLWIEALRSGEYKQGTGRLNMVNEAGASLMCCLGVLCDLYIKQTGKGEWVNDNGIKHFTSSTEKYVAMLPPIEVVQWAGLTTNRGMKNINLDSMNDGIGQPCHSYDEIAIVIEECF